MHHAHTIARTLVLATLVATAFTSAGTAAAEGWPTDVGVIAAADGKAVEVKGKIDGGKKIDLKFAASSSVACFPATEFVNFEGNHVFHGTTLPKQSVMTITLIPDDKTLDLNLYALQVSDKSFDRIPPKVTSATACEASYDQKTDSNPGVTEKITLNATTNAYNVVIGVAGPKGVVKGGYTLKVELKTAATGNMTALVAAPLISNPKGAVSVQGKLDGGSTIDLAWASKSSMACWPATQNQNFNGKHVLYRTSLPAYSDMVVTATPSDPKLDLSVYAYMVSSTDTTSVPPTVASATTCEAGYDQKTSNNPGKAESLKLNSVKNPYTVYIGVAGANGAATGAFDLKVEIKPKS